MEDLQKAEVKSISFGKEQGFINPASSPYVLYGNAFTAGQTTTDIYILGLLNGVPNFTINMSFTSAKSLQIALNTVLERFEENAEHPIPSVSDVQKIMASAAEKDKK